MELDQFLVGLGGFVFGLLVSYMFIVIKKGLTNKNK